MRTHQHTTSATHIHWAKHTFYSIIVYCKSGRHFAACMFLLGSVWDLSIKLKQGVLYVSRNEQRINVPVSDLYLPRKRTKGQRERGMHWRWRDKCRDVEINKRQWVKQRMKTGRKGGHQVQPEWKCSIMLVVERCRLDVDWQAWQWRCTHERMVIPGPTAACLQCGCGPNEW